MRGCWAIYRREMYHYFVSPIAYIVVGVFLGLSGYFFNLILVAVIQMSLQQGFQAARFGASANFDVPGMVLRSFLNLLGSLSLFIIPVLTMGVYAEEKKRGTMELLLTSPVTDTQIVLGKFFATLTLFVILLLPTLCYQAFLFHASHPTPPWRVVLAGYLGALLLGSVLIGLGSLISSLTENQIVAAVVTFGVFLVLWVLDAGTRASSGTLHAVLHYISMLRRYHDFTMGIVDTASLIFFLSVTVLALFLTLRSLDSMRWRRA
jgi:gliding motility-associated transport system permease protein